MYKKYKFPLQLFIFFEKVNPAIWTSDVSNKNCLFSFLPGKAGLGLSVFLKNELFLGANYLVDASCVDMQHMHRGGRQFSKVLVFYIFYFLFLKNRVIFCFLNSSTLSSIDSVYPNANWLEREFAEMFGVSLVNKIDARNLLLDYSLSENPMLRDFPSVGYREVYYSVFSESVSYSNGAVVEL